METINRTGTYIIEPKRKRKRGKLKEERRKHTFDDNNYIYGDSKVGNVHRNGEIDV